MSKCPSTPAPPDPPTTWSTWPNHDLLPDPTAPLYTLDADELVRQLKAQHGSAIAGRTMCGLIIWQVMNDGGTLEEALTIAEKIARDIAPSFVMKAMWVGCAVLIRTDPKANEELRKSLASDNN